MLIVWYSAAAIWLQNMHTLEGQFSVKSYAFSFGVVVLEIISGGKRTPASLTANLP